MTTRARSRTKIPMNFAAELGGGNIHEFSSGFLFMRKYWYTNNLTDELSRIFHKTLKRHDIQALEMEEFKKIAEFIFKETEGQPTFIGLAADYVVKKTGIDYRYVKMMYDRGLLHKCYFRPKEIRKMLFMTLRSDSEIEVMFPSRSLVTSYFVKKERSGESREIHSDELKGGMDF